jgi:branched-chain amino acid transport system permease protein
LLIQLIINGIISGSIYSLNAFGFTLIYGVMNFFNMAHGAIFLLGAYSGYVFYIKLNIYFPIAVIMAIVVVAILMMFIDRIAFYPIRIKKAPGWAFVISSIGVAIMVEACITLLFSSEVRSLKAGPVKPGYELWGAVITRNQLIILITSVVIMLLVTLFLKKTKIGVSMRGIASNPEMATIVGIPVNRIYLVTFAFGSALTAIAGILVSLETDIDPYIGSPALLKAIVASIIGGIGNIPGALFGGLLLGMIENFAVWKIAGGWKDGISLAILILFILIRPSLFGIETQK